MRLVQVDLGLHHVPGSVTLVVLIQKLVAIMLYNGKHLMGVMFPKDLVKLLVIICSK